MNVGDRKMQISSAAHPAMRTSPMAAQTVARVACRASVTASRPTPRDAFTSTVSPGATRPATSPAASAASATARVVPANGPAMWAARGATVKGAGKVLERTVRFYAEWLAAHERPHLKQIERIARALKE